MRKKIDVNFKYWKVETNENQSMVFNNSIKYLNEALKLKVSTAFSTNSAVTDIHECDANDVIIN